ncbi:MAG: O-methyltransferase [Bacteroidales bacterium]|nr:MAG: O-methyltransferase [Bacteroidales bacterium]
MLKFDQRINDYIHKYTTPEDKILQDLYRETNLKVLYPRMLAGHLQGKILEMISKMICPENILEIGTYTGYSAICLAKGLSENGKVHTIERNDELMDISGKYFKKAGFKNRIVQYTGDAKSIIPQLNLSFELVYIDSDKYEYLDIYHLVFDKVPPGGYILADNVLWEGKVFKKSKPVDKETRGIIEFNNFVKDDERVENTILPFRDGLMIIRKNK